MPAYEALKLQALSSLMYNRGISRVQTKWRCHAFLFAIDHEKNMLITVERQFNDGRFVCSSSRSDEFDFYNKHFIQVGLSVFTFSENEDHEAV